MDRYSKGLAAAISTAATIGNPDFRTYKYWKQPKSLQISNSRTIKNLDTVLQFMAYLCIFALVFNEWLNNWTMVLIFKLSSAVVVKFSWKISTF